MSKPTLDRTADRTAEPTEADVTAPAVDTRSATTEAATDAATDAAAVTVARAARGGRVARLAVLTLAAGGVLAAAGAYGGTASAYWSAGGSGDGVAVTAAAPTITAVPAGAAGLYPGGTTTLPVTVSNPGDAALTLSTVTPGTITSPTAGCAAVVAATAPGTLPVVPAHGSVTVNLTVTMGASAANACQGASFTVPLALTARL